MGPLTECVMLVSIVMSAVGGLLLCMHIQDHNRKQARRELFGLPPLD